MNKNPRYLKNGKVDTTYISFNRNYTKLKYSPQITFLPNYDFNLVEIELEGDLQLDLNVQFSSFGDVLCFYLRMGEKNRVSFIEGFEPLESNIFTSTFIEFIFDGEKFIPKTSNKEGLVIGDKIKNSRSNGILFTENGEIHQDSDHFHYDADSKRLGIGTNVVRTHLTLCGRGNNGLQHLLNNADDNESSIGFGKIGEPIRFVFGMFNDRFGVKDLISGKFYNLIEDKELKMEVKTDLKKKGKK